MLSITKLQENIEEFDRKLGRSSDPVLALIQLGAGVDVVGEEIAARLVASGALEANAPLVQELTIVTRDQRIVAANHAAKYLYSTGVQTQITGAAEGPVRFDMTKMIADPAMADAIQQIQMNYALGAKKETED